MALIEQITQLRDSSLLALDSSHDYFAHTRYAGDSFNESFNKAMPSRSKTKRLVVELKRIS